MKELKDYKEEIHRCSKCGLCQAVCPVYLTTGNECTVCRGQFVMLDGIIKGKLKLNKNINKYLDLCLKCGKCKDFCPSEIDVVDILIAAKYMYFKHSLSGKIYKILESKLIFNTFFNSLKLCSSLFSKHKKSKPFHKKAVYFGGCISKLRPDINNYVIELLNKMEIEVVEIDFNCCGMPFLSTGNLERFTEQLIENAEKLPDNIDCLITDCASCEWIWKQYIKYADKPKIKDKLSKVNIRNLYELLIENNIQFTAKTPQKITFHKPCHESANIEKLLKNCNAIEYEQMDGYDECCGFAGFEHPAALSAIYKIMRLKRNNIKKTSANTVLTTCSGCLSCLNIILFLSGKKIRSLTAFLKDNCKFRQ